MNPKLTNSNLLRFRVVIIALSLLLMTLSSLGEHTVVEGRESVKKERQSLSGEEIVGGRSSPLRQQHRLRFSLVDIELSFWYLPASSTTNSFETSPLATIETATRHFLALGLNEDEGTKVIDLNVRVLSQNDSNIQPSTTATILEINNADSIAAHVLTTLLEITIQYELTTDNLQANDMGKRITRLLTSRAREVLDLLLLLDTEFFATVFAIGSESSKAPLMVSKQTSSDIVGSDGDRLKWQSLGLFVVIGLIGVISIGIGVIFLCTLLPKKSREVEGLNHKEKKMIKEPPVPTVFIRNVVTENTTEDLPSVTQSSEIIQAIDSISKDSIEPSIEITSSEFLRDKQKHAEEQRAVFSRKGIQTIYTEDKLPYNPIQKLRRKKDDAESNLKSYINGYCSKWMTAGSASETLRPSKLISHSRINSRIRMKEEKCDIESQIQNLKKKRNAIEQRIRKKYETLIDFSPSECRDANEIIKSRVTREDTIGWVGPVEVQGRFNAIDDDDISALTYGSFYGVDGDQDMKILFNREKRVHSVETVNHHRRHITNGYILPYTRKVNF